MYFMNMMIAVSLHWAVSDFVITESDWLVEHRMPVVDRVSMLTQEADVIDIAPDTGLYCTEAVSGITSVSGKCK